MMLTGLANWRIRWERLGVPVIPLQRNRKKPAANSWNTIPPLQQWHEVGDSFHGNLGIVLGNGYVCVDCDASTTIKNVQAHLKALGITPPYVMTPSGGRHYYLVADKVPPNFNWKLLSNAVGPGELRARNAYVVAPCSKVDSKRYRFDKGGPEDIPRQRKIHWKDLAALLPSANVATAAMIYVEPPVPLIYRPELSSKINILLKTLPLAVKGQPIERYPTRSEAEAAIVTNLILAGWRYEKIRQLFENHKPGHYWEAGASRRQYLHHTYRKVLTHLATTPERQKLVHFYAQCPSWNWPGRGGRTDLAVFRAITAKAWQFDSLQVQISIREIAEHACTSRSTVSTSLGRLSAMGYIKKRDIPMHIIATCWEVCAWTNPDNSQNTTANNSQNTTATRDCSGNEDWYARADIPSHTHVDTTARELWSYNALGRTAEVVYCHLGDVARTEKALAQAIGCHMKTVARNLERLAEHHLAEKKGPHQWVRGKTTLEDVAQKLGTTLAAISRRNQHERERENWRNQERN